MGTADDVLVLSIDIFEPGMDMQSLFQMVEPETALREPESPSFAQEQRKDGEILAMTQYLEKGILPDSTKDACWLATQAPLFTLIDEILYYLDDKQPGVRHIVVPKHLREHVMQEYHSGNMAGHFSGARLYRTLVRR